MIVVLVFVDVLNVANKTHRTIDLREYRLYDVDSLRILV